jgi:dihydrofolate reductase
MRACRASVPRRKARRRQRHCNSPAAGPVALSRIPDVAGKWLRRSCRTWVPTSWDARCLVAAGGPWDQAWTGRRGENPPYHVPVFVLTHHRCEPLVMQGGTTFTFVTDGPASALERARGAAGEKEVAIAGGANIVQQYLAAGLLDELYLHIVPVILGAGERLLKNVGDPNLQPVRVIESPAVTHVKYRVIH